MIPLVGSGEYWGDLNVGVGGGMTAFVGLGGVVGAMKEAVPTFSPTAGSLKDRSNAVICSGPRPAGFKKLVKSAGLTACCGMIRMTIRLDISVLRSGWSRRPMAYGMVSASSVLFSAGPRRILCTSVLPGPGRAWPDRAAPRPQPAAPARRARPARPPSVRRARRPPARDARSRPLLEAAAD